MREEGGKPEEGGMREGEGGMREGEDERFERRGGGGGDGDREEIETFLRRRASVLFGGWECGRECGWKCGRE